MRSGARQKDSQLQALWSCKRGDFVHRKDQASDRGSDCTSAFLGEKSFYLFPVAMMILTPSGKCSEIYRWGEASLLSSCEFPNLLLLQFSCSLDVLDAPFTSPILWVCCCRLGSKEHLSFPMQIHWWKHKMHYAAKTCWACLDKCQGLTTCNFTIDLTTMMLCALNTDGICSVFRMWALRWKKGIASNFLSLFGFTKADCWYYINSLDKINISLCMRRVDI